jgi:hypothetical protein
MGCYVDRFDLEGAALVDVDHHSSVLHYFLGEIVLLGAVWDVEH